MRKVTIFLFALVVGISGVIWFSKGGSEQKEHSNRILEERERGDVSLVSRSESAPRQRGSILGSSFGKEDVVFVELTSAEEFGKLGNSALDNLASLVSLICEYDLVLKQEGIPTGMNEDFVDALTGNNSERIQVLSRDHPRIDDEGRLIDNWQSPYFFHSESSTEFEIRSAGPDRELFTEDDIIQGTGA